MTIKPAMEPLMNAHPLRTKEDTIPGVLWQFRVLGSGNRELKYVSSRCEELFGIRADPATFFPQFFAGVAPEDREAFLTSLDNAVKGRRTWEFRGRYIRAAGEDVSFQALAEPLKTGDELEYNGVVLDITAHVLAKRALRTNNPGGWRTVQAKGTKTPADTNHPKIFPQNGNFRPNWHALLAESKQAGEALRASEVRYRRLFETAQDGILILDADTGRIMDVNPFLLDMLGFPREQILGKTLWEIGLFKDIVANKDNFRELQQKEYIRYEDRPLATSYGKQIDVEFVSNVYTVTDMKVIQCNIRNISDRKRVEEALCRKNEELDGYFTNSLDLICIADGDGQFRRMNREWETVLGYSAAELEGKRLLDFVHPDDLESARGVFSELGAGRQVTQYMNRYKHRDGSYRWIEWRLFPATNRIYASARDITERKKMAEQIETSLAEKEILLKEIHHRVKNNLQIISSLLNMQIRKTSDPITTEALRESQNRVLSMALVHEHLYKGKDFTYIDLMNYIHALGIGLFQSYETEKQGIRFDLDIRDIHVDISTAIPLGLISNELITNSLKYAFNDKPGGKLTISATQDPGIITFIVEDNGSGIPKEVTLENQSSLGLRLVNTLTSQLKGTVVIERNGGTKFVITIPRMAEGSTGV